MSRLVYEQQQQKLNVKRFLLHCDLNYGVRFILWKTISQTGASDSSLQTFVELECKKCFLANLIFLYMKIFLWLLSKEWQ